MRYSLLILSALLFAMVGCGPKEETASGDNPTPKATTGGSTTGGESADKSGGETGGETGGAVTNDQVVGEWTMSSQQPTSQVEADIVINADGTFTNTGTVTSEQDQEAASMKSVMTYTIEGKWKLEGDMLVSTPEKVDLKVDEMDIKAKGSCEPGRYRCPEGRNDEEDGGAG